MMLQLVVAQARPQPETSAAFSAGYVIGMVVVAAVMLAMVGGAVSVLIKWPDRRGGRAAFAVPLLLLPFTGAIVFGLAQLADIELPPSAMVVVPLAWFLWVALMVIASRRIKRFTEELARNAAFESAQRARDRQTNPAAPSPPVRAKPPAVQPSAAPLDENAPAFARCAACMGRWKTTKAEADTLDACPKCGASPPDLRLQRA